MISMLPNSLQGRLLTGLAALLVTGIGSASQAQSASYSVTGWDYEQQAGLYTLGYTFTPTVNVAVSALGEWVPGTGAPINNSSSLAVPGTAGAFVTPEQVGIFDNLGHLILTTTLTDINATLTSNTLASGSEFQYADITSSYTLAERTLTAGQTYTMAGTSYNSYSTNATGGITGNPLINITSDGLATVGDTLSGVGPYAPGSDYSYNMYSVNFEVSPAGSPRSTPEPGSMAMLTGIAIAGSAFVRRRASRRRRI